MQRVALVAHWDWVLVNFQLPLAKALREKGYEVVLICPPGQFVGDLESAGFRWLDWRIERRSLNPFKEMAALMRLIALYRKVRPDIAHHFTIKPTVYGSIAARCVRVPVVLNAFAGLGYVFSDVSGARTLRKLLVPVMRSVLAIPRGHIILENQEDRHAFETYRVATRDRMTVIPGSGVNGVDTRRFRPRDREKSGDVVVLFAGRLLQDKGVREYVEAASALKSKVVGVQFWVAGEPDPGNPACIDREVLKTWQAEGLVRFLGFCSNMDELLREVDIAVLPSYHEGLPRFLLEAAASGLPIVTTAVEGCRLVVRHEENGLLVAPRNSGELAEAIGRLLGEASERTRMGKRGREWVERNFSQEKVVGQYLELYGTRIQAVAGNKNP